MQAPVQTNIKQLASALLYLLMLGTTSAEAQTRVDDVGDPLPPGVVYRLGSSRMRHFRPTGLRFTPDGRHLLSIGDGDECREWDVATGKLLRVLPLDAFPSEFSHDGRRAVNFGTDQLHVVDWADGKLLRAFSLKQPVDAKFSADDKTLVAVTADHWVYRWDLASGKELSHKQVPIAAAPNHYAPTVSLSPDGAMVAGVTQPDRDVVDRTPFGKMTVIPLRFWDTTTGAEARASLPVAARYYDCRWSPDMSRLHVLARPHDSEIWDFKTGKRLESSVEKLEDAASTAAKQAVSGDRPASDMVVYGDLTPDGRHLVSRYSCYDMSARKILWKRDFSPHVSGGAMKVSEESASAVSPVGTLLAVGCTCGHIALVDWKTGKDEEFSTLRGGMFDGPWGAVQFSKDGARMLLKDAKTDELLLHDVRTGKQLRRLKSIEDYYGWSIAANRIVDWQTDDNLGDSSNVVMKELDSGKELWKLRTDVSEAEFVDDGKSVVLHGKDREADTLRRLNATTGKETAVFRLPATAMFHGPWVSPDGRLIVLIDQPGPDRRELQARGFDGATLWTWKIPESRFENSKWATFHPESKIVAVSWSGRTAGNWLTLFDATTGKVLHDWAIKRDADNMKVTDDGRYILTFGAERDDVRDLSSGKLLFQIERVVESTPPTHTFGSSGDPIFAPDGKRCAYVTLKKGERATFEARELPSGRVVGTLPLPNERLRYQSFAPDGRTIALVFNDCTVWMWDCLATAKP